MRTSTTNHVATDRRSTTDHQRTYVADQALHRRLLASVGDTVTLDGGARYSIRRGIGPVVLDRTLATRYFDTDELDLHRSGAMLRCRGRQEKDGESPATGVIEARIPEGSGVQRIAGFEQPFDQLVADIDPAAAAVRHLTNGRQLRAVATQIKTRQLLFASSGALGRYRPDIVITLDEVQLERLQDSGQRVNRHEVELQIFTKLPWTRHVDDDRVNRFDDFAISAESIFGLVAAEESSYQAVPMELLS